MQYKYYAELAAAIIIQAKNDYTSAKATADEYPLCKSAKRTCKECYDFFHSEWFSQLVVIAGKTLDYRLGWCGGENIHESNAR